MHGYGSDSLSESKISEFIFSESEFESESFHAASFVGKYRRVTPLESLRDQLRNYVQALKDQVSYCILIKQKI